MTPVPQSDRTLGNVKLFSELSDADCRAMASQCDWQRYSTGNQIVYHLDASRNVFFIVSGSVRAVVHSLSGRQVSYRDISEGELFGEFAAIDGMPRSANVVALSDCVIASLTPERFWQVLREHPSVTAKLLKHLTSLVRFYSDRVRELATLPVNVRVQIELLRLAKPTSSEADVSIIEPAPTHAEIANRIGTHREAVTRALNALRRDKILRSTKGRLVIDEFQRLQHAVTQAIGE